ncbi:hypothetical protein BGZ54_009313 [Gamsiella multidivaricata]|nr:hypothetical protein BGZ54_009313 [Gamsiella multidivaricata]
MQSSLILAFLAVATTASAIPAGAASQTADLAVGPSGSPVPVYDDHHISRGSIAGIVLGILALTALAALLGLCWRKRRHNHRAFHYDNYGNTGGYGNNGGYGNTGGYGNDAHRSPSRTVVTEKIEPVVVKSGPNAGSSTAAPAGAGAGGYHNTTAPGAGANNYNTGGVNTNPTSTTAGGYSTQPRNGVV